MELSEKKAINGTTLKVTFNKSVNAASALDVENYKLGGTAFDATHLVDGVATLSADKRTVTFNFKAANKLAADTPKYLEISGVQDLEDKKIEDYKKIFEFSDKTAATVVGVTYPTNTSAVIEFSEPMKAITTGQVQVLDSNNQVVATATATATAVGDTKLTINTTDLELNKTYTVKVYNAEDLYGNFGGTYTTTLTKTSEDKTAPELVSAVGTELNKVKITFNEPVQNNAGTVTVDGGAPVDLSTTPGVLSEDKKTLTVTLASSVTAGLHTVKVNGIKDISGNAIATDKSLLTNFSADTTAPKVKSTKVSNGKLYVTFDENITVQSVTDMLPTVSYVSNNVEYTKSGDEVFTAYNPSAAAEYDTIVLDLSDFATGSYTATLAAGTVKDLAAATTANAATTIKFDYTASDSNKPVVVDNDDDVKTGASGISQVGNVVTVKFDRELDAATALNVANYTVDGEAVFKSAIFSGNTKTVKLTLKDNALTNPDTIKYQFAIKNVKSVSGVVMNDVVFHQTLDNTVAPTVLSAKITSSTSIVVTFSKDVTVSANAFDLYIGGTKVETITQTAVTNAAKTLTLATTTALTEADIAKGITIKAVDSAVIKDDLENENQLVNGVSVNVTK